MAMTLREASRRSRLLFSTPATTATTAAAAPWVLCSRSRSSPFSGDSRPLETLAFEEIRASADEPFHATAFVLHGLLGSGRNWRSFSRNLAAELRKSNPSAVWRMVLIDLRNHGRSAGLKGLDPPHDMVNAAKDLANLVKSRDWAWPDVVIGHSMGGKVALEFATSCARGDYGKFAVLPKQLWVLDSVPGEVKQESSDGEVELVLHTLQSLPSPLPSRKWVVDHMLKLGFSKLLSKWIGSNLKDEGEHVVWAFDLQAAKQMFQSYRDTSYWPILEHPPENLEIDMLQAEKSDRWSEELIERLRLLSKKEQAPEEGKVKFHVLPDSGHWVHVDNPKGLLDILASNFYLKA